jgi:hypothetical protein
MQSLPVYLYPNSLEVILDLDPDVRGVNQVMYQRDLKIQKGIKNNVRIQFKNSDQKRIPISNTSTFVFNMFDSSSQELVLQKQLTILDASTSTRGLALLTINEGDTVNLDSVPYNYSIVYQDPTDGTYLPAYTNTYYGIAGTLHLTEEVYPKLKPSQEITSFLRSYNDRIRLYEYKSGNVYAYPEYNSNTALHTMAIYMTNYTGTVTIEGTLYNSPQSFGRYANVSVKTYNGFTGIDYVNFNGVFSYVRVVNVPAPNLTGNNTDTAFSGTVDKVLYRS